MDVETDDDGKYKLPEKKNPGFEDILLALKLKCYHYLIKYVNNENYIIIN